MVASRRSIYSAIAELIRCGPTRSMLTLHLPAGSLVLPLTTNPAPSLPPTNEHLSHSANHVNNAQSVLSDSDSDLSDIVDPNNTRALSSSAEKLGFMAHDNSNTTITDSSHNDDAAGSEDADYDVETPPPVEVHTVRDERSTSQDSRRPAKRKAGLEDDEHIMNNPELYGLRRSVSHLGSS